MKAAGIIAFRVKEIRSGIRSQDSLVHYVYLP
jgi:hypothetical protein